MTKKCCYMDRDCTPDCIAYSSNVGDTFEDICEGEMTCLRLFTELAQAMLSVNPAHFEDDEDDYEYI